MATNEELNKEMEQLKKDLKGIQSDISSLAGTLKSAGVEQGRATYGRVKHQGDELRRRGGEAASSVSEAIDERPITSVLTAFGTGFVIGLLLNQRRH